jgi:hypothetical protein
MDPAVRAASVDQILALLGRAERLAHAIAERHGGADDGRALLGKRLAPDMFSLAEQAVVLADGLVGALALLAGRKDDPRAAFVFNRGHGMDLGPLPGTPDEIAALFGASRRAATVLADTAVAGDGTVVRLARPGDERLFYTADFLLRYVLPNGEFHLAMIHAIARSAGIPVGKGDFEGPRPWRRHDE